MFDIYHGQFEIIREKSHWELSLAAKGERFAWTERNNARPRTNHPAKSKMRPRSTNGDKKLTRRLSQGGKEGKVVLG